MIAADTPSPLPLGETIALLRKEAKLAFRGEFPNARAQALTRAAVTLEGLDAGLAEFFDDNPTCADAECGHFDCYAIRRLRAVVGTGAEGGKGDG